MSEILAAALTLPTLGVALLVWGFAPPLVNRIFSCIYPANDARRRDMVAELNAVPRWEQPFWVLQQAERALSEGIPARLRDERYWRQKSFDTWRAVHALSQDPDWRGVRLLLRPRGASSDTVIIAVTHLTFRNVSYLTEDGLPGTLRTGDILARGSSGVLQFYSGGIELHVPVGRENPLEFHDRHVS